ncbi:uncharacterized protein YecE (DUF72 family) [Variovorax boronicumulans]|uniref:DUF72 domain-containing protein n=1 Tax=Variovorax boronicumulans TaxID=436515 RepID=UPI002473AD43|nr:DUF72 domain-containing protein [Variovorax boronicumulans]MDH6168211.1 uncharacterized protein YecE (DUF72 family) [Variovorax boronicumulans]
MTSIIPELPRIGCAGWSLPRALWPEFPAEGSHLERYAQRFDAVEIDTSFYRPHRRETYERWATSTPDGFRFAVKLPKTITHERRLAGAMPAFDEFLAQAEGLGDRLGCLVVQLPPSLAFDADVVLRFLADVRQRHAGPVVLEPRHRSWFVPAAESLLSRFQVGRVLADPVLFDEAAAPGGWPGLVYLRLHGSPRRYWSAYDDALLERLATRLRLAREEGAACWCILDNTAGGEAVGNAMTLARLLQNR